MRNFWNLKSGVFTASAIFEQEEKEVILHSCLPRSTLVAKLLPEVDWAAKLPPN